MKTSTPVRIDADLYAAASSIAPTMSRSTAQQISHWANIGRELEASPGVSVEHVARVLAGSKSYDSLATEEEQALVRSFWAARIGALSDNLRLEDDFIAEGRPYAELDETGAAVRREPTAKD